MVVLPYPDSESALLLYMFTAPQFEYEIFACTHTNEGGESIIHIDHIQRGVGTGSRGPQTLPKYCVEPGTYEFEYVIRPYTRELRKN